MGSNLLLRVRTEVDRNEHHEVGRLTLKTIENERAKHYEVSEDQMSYMKIIEGTTFHEYQLKIKQE